MTFFRRERSMASQIGYATTTGAAYTVGGGDIAFAGNQVILWRHTLPIPKGSTVQDATLKINVIAMKNSAQAQTCINSVRAIASGDSPALIPGTTSQTNGPWTTARIDWPMVWPVSPPDLVYMTLNVKPIIEEIMARSDYKSEGYITFMLFTDNENGSDMGMRANNGFFIGPQLEVNYTEPTTGLRTTFNHHENPILDSTISTLEANKALGLYEQNEFFGGFVAAANQGSIVKDTSFMRVAGVPTLRFTCGTKDADLNKRTGWTYPFRIEASAPVMFTCWLYISSAIPTNAGRFEMGDVYVSMQSVNTRGSWIPVCTPIMNVSSAGTRWWTTGIKDYQPGWQYWMSEPAIIYGSFKQMPFIGATATKDPDIAHKASVSKQMSVREWTPRRYLTTDGVTTKSYPTWTMRSDGIFVLSEPIKGGPTVLQSGTTQVANLPAGLTISEL